MAPCHQLPDGSGERFELAGQEEEERRVTFWKCSPFHKIDGEMDGQ